MATLASLRTKAKAAGIPVSKVRKASAEELRSLIAEANGKPRKSTARKAVKKSVARKSVTKRAPAAKSTRGKAKRPSTTARSNGTSGRNLIAKVDFNKDKGWEPREGSAPDRIIKALKKFKGNREKAFESLKGDVWDFVGKTMRNGDKRTKQDAYAVLRYRIHRTLFDFAVKTGQHKISTNRIEYGTGPNASKATQRKLAKGRAKAEKAPARTPARRGRPPKKRGPGRPKGSKNKTK